MNGADLSALFDSVTRTAFRLETLQTYDVSGELDSVRAFRDGLPRPERSVRTNPFLRRIALQTAVGVQWSRVRVVEYPLTEYVRYELLGYVESQAAGEQISLVDREVARDLGPDFWLLDAGMPSARAVLMHYDEEGRIVDRELTTDPDVLVRLAGQQAAAETYAVPLNAFLVGRVDA